MCSSGGVTSSAWSRQASLAASPEAAPDWNATRLLDLNSTDRVRVGLVSREFTPAMADRSTPAVSASAGRGSSMSSREVDSLR
jgi:hypothetical protein